MKKILVFIAAGAVLYSSCSADGTWLIRTVSDAGDDKLFLWKAK